MLGEQRPGLEIAAYRGVLTPVELDVRGAEIEALVSRAAVHDLGWRRRVEVRGEDRFRWLSGMVTNMVKDLGSGSGAWNLVLNAQGRIQGDLTIWREAPQHERFAAEGDADGLELELAADQFDRLMVHLDRFIIMDDVELAAQDPAEETALGLTGPEADEVLARIGIKGLPEQMTQAHAQWNGISVRIRREYGVLARHYVLFVAANRVMDLWNAMKAAGAQPAGSAALEAFRIAEGIPAYGLDIAERDLPQETSQLRALHFSKGCYLGQEIVERIRSRGNVHRHLRGLEVDGPVPASGTELQLDGIAAGHVTSAAELSFDGKRRVFAMGMIKAEAEARNVPFGYAGEHGGGAARLLNGPPLLNRETF